MNGIRRAAPLAASLRNAGKRSTSLGTPLFPPRPRPGPSAPAPARRLCAPSVCVLRRCHASHRGSRATGPRREMCGRDVPCTMTDEPCSVKDRRPPARGSGGLHGRPDDLAADGINRQLLVGVAEPRQFQTQRPAGGLSSGRYCPGRMAMTERPSSSPTIVRSRSPGATS